jgi:uncharacterized protein (UPF0333 family)
MRSFKTKLNARGATHLIVILLVVVGVGVVGSYFLIKSHAASTTVNCSSNGKTSRYGREYNCRFYRLAKVENGHTNSTIHAGTNWVVCQQQGGERYIGSSHNNWWAWTLSDQGTWGWVNAVYGSGGVNDGSYSRNVPNCNSSHGVTPR